MEDGSLMMTLWLVLLALLIIIMGYYFFYAKSQNAKAQKDIWLSSMVLPADLDDYLAKQESVYTEIVPRTEKMIIWNTPHQQQQTAISVVFVHGFSASRQELSPLTENIAQRLGANLYLTRLTGHGQTGNAMQDVSVAALLNDVREAYEIGKRIGERVLLIGNSTGATLLTYLASHISTSKILGFVLLSPNYGLKDKQSEWLLMPFAKYWMPILKGRYYEFVPRNELQARYWTCKYPITALVQMMKLVELTRKSPLSNVKTATLVLYSDEDPLIDNQQVKQVFEKLGSPIKTLEVVSAVQTGVQHVIAGDILSPHTTQLVEEKILKFITLLRTDTLLTESLLPDSMQ